MLPYKFAGEWIFSQAQDLEVVDFSGWRKTPKGRRFLPWLHLRAGEMDIILDDYHVIWTFLDAILGTPPRSDLNSLMQGHFDYYFAPELRLMLREAEGTLCFGGKNAFAHVPNTDNEWVEDAHVVYNCKYVSIDPINPADPDIILTPRRTSANTDFVRTRVMGLHPQIVFLRDDRVVLGFVHGKTAFRPFPMLRYDTYALAEEAARHMHYHMSEETYEPMNDGRGAGLGTRIGMYETERDVLECDYFSMYKKEIIKKKRGD